MSMVKVRETIAAISAIILVLIMAGVGATMAGWNIPILSNIVRWALGQ
ncbi:MAG: hypothetical protein N3G21_03765 [Candidatus Hydrogenedentes bacterium]|nr:hypothetical protein [Candidatus Hydrogenedentota bacterium]